MSSRTKRTAGQGQPVNGVSTSSSSAPSLMALMLEALDVHDGHKILEIGTGTGYNTALLCHRVGPRQVTSIDIDPGLIANARQRLAMFNYAPQLATFDGTAGCRARAPFDRAAGPPVTASVSPSTTTDTPCGSTVQAAHTSGRFRRSHNPIEHIQWLGSVVSRASGRDHHRAAVPAQRARPRRRARVSAR